MIMSCLLSLVGIAATSLNVSDAISDWFSDRFGDSNVDPSANITNFFWEQIDYGKATISTSTSLFEGWLTGMDLGSWMSDVSDDLSNALQSAGDTTGMSTLEIIDAINSAGFDPTTYSWEDDLGITDAVEMNHDILVNFEILSLTEGFNLSKFTSIDGMKSVLNDYGYEDDSYSLSDINNYHSDTVLMALADDLNALFIATNHDYNGLTDELGSDWVGGFMGALDVISYYNRSENEVCEDDYVYDILQNEGYTTLQWTRKCAGSKLLNNPPDCDCLDGAGIYGDEDKEAVVNSLNCFFEEGDDLTVKQTLLECNNEQIILIQDAFEIFQDLTDLLTEDNFDNLNMDTDTSELSVKYQGIIDSYVDLINTTISVNGTEEDYINSLSDWLDKLATHASALNLDGTYADEAQEISDLVDSTKADLLDESESGSIDDDDSFINSTDDTSLNSSESSDVDDEDSNISESNDDDVDSNDDDDTSKSSSSIQFWVWIVIAIAVVCIFLGIYCVVSRKNAKIAEGIKTQSFEVEKPNGETATTAGDSEL